MSRPDQNAAKRDHGAGTGTPIRPVEWKPRQLRPPGSRRRYPRPFTFMVLAVVLALLGAAIFVFSARTVALETTPSADRLAVSGGLTLLVGEHHLMLPGDYLLRAEKEGYHPLEQTIEVSTEARQRFHFELVRLPGRLALEIEPAAAAAVVRIDGELVGEVPAGTAALDPVELLPGEHEIRIRAPRHVEHVERIEIEGRGVVQNLRAELIASWAPVSFDSRPAGAAIVVGGDALGKTPAELELGAGDHRYELRLPGFKVFRGRFAVTAGEPLELPLARLEPADAKLRVASVPAGAAVAVGGIFRDAAPLELTLNPGRHEISFSKAGHEAVQRVVDLEAGEEATLTVELEPRFGEIEIAVQPPGAVLRVDGDVVEGEASRVLRLAAVPHRIEVEKDGYEPFSTSVTPLEGVSQKLVIDLESRAAAAAEATAATAPAAVIETSEGHTLRLVEPARFEMGASRREPGRRANETLREVEITRPFYLAVHEVTNRQFRRFDEDHRSGQLGGHNLEVDHHPAVRMTRDRAAAYCNWLSRQEGLPPAYVKRGASWALVEPPTVGYRLPTEAEWALAARGTAGLKYPWGDRLPVPAAVANYADSTAREYLPGVIPDYRDGFPATAPVDSFAANALGLYNLGGNVSEWVHDVYALRPPAARLGALETDPVGPIEGDLYVIRGSSFLHSTVTELRLSFRDYGSEPRPDVGFRIARWVE